MCVANVLPEGTVILVRLIALITLKVALRHMFRLMLHQVRHGLCGMATGVTFEISFITVTELVHLELPATLAAEAAFFTFKWLSAVVNQHMSGELRFGFPFVGATSLQ